MSKILLTSAALAHQAHGLNVELDYRFDRHGFFEQPGAKTAMRAVADFFESIIDDSLLGIDPAKHGGSWTAIVYDPSNPFSGNSLVEIPNLVVAENTVIVFPGGADFGASGVGGSGGSGQIIGSADWVSRVRFRGKTGAATTPPTEFGPWGGMVSFGMNATWNFSLDRNILGMTSFVAVAVHEVAHVLGFGSAPSWMAQQGNGYFYGSYAMNSFGEPVPLNPDGAHWRDDLTCKWYGSHDPGNPANVLSKTYGSFGTAHGVPQIALMDPTSCLAGDRIKVFTDLDIGALLDIGWKVRPKPSLAIAGPKNGATEVRFRWVTTSFEDYRIERGGGAAGWETVIEISGDGAERDIGVPTGGAKGGFFRMGVQPKALAEPVASAASVTPAHAAAAAGGGADVPPVLMADCFCHPAEAE